MVKKKSHQKFTRASLVRLLIFGVIIYVFILYISPSISHKKFSDSAPPPLPPIIVTLVDNIASSSAFRDLSDKIGPKIEEVKKLPQQEYDKFKDQLIRELLNRLDKVLRQS